MKVQALIDGILQREGGYSNRPSDRGGPTCWGITEAVGRANGYAGPMQEMPQEVARNIYFRRYWIDPGFAQVADLSPAVAEELADTGINMGPEVAATMLQRVLTAMNQQGRLYPDLTPDGHIGPVTIAALRAYLQRRGREGESVLLRALNCLQGARYIEITESRPANEDFVYGWIRERVA